MIWTKFKKELISRFAEKIQKDLNIYMTRYGQSWDTSRLWITINGEEVINFSTAESFANFGAGYNELTVDKSVGRHSKIEDDQRIPGLLIEKGEFSCDDFIHCCHRYLVHMSIEDAQESPHPITRMLAVLDKRTGKRKLQDIYTVETNPMVKYFAEYRLGKEGRPQFFLNTQ